MTGERRIADRECGGGRQWLREEWGDCFNITCTSGHFLALETQLGALASLDSLALD